MSGAGDFTIDPIGGGVTAPAGFRAAGVACGIKPAALDLALVVADGLATAAGVFTKNRAAAAPVMVSREHLARSGGWARAIVANSGCANACTGARGLADARAMAAETAERLGCRPEEVLVASTGVIGVALPLPNVVAGIDRAVAALGRDRHLEAARAIMTTDREPKETAVRVEAPWGSFRVGGMAKGAGMIAPMMATMLAFVTTDAAVAPELLKLALADAVDETFNAITVDGDTSTNDTVFALASGASGVEIDQARWPALALAFRHVAETLARAIVRNGEGATKLVTVRVTGARSPADARRAARALATSLLVKTAVHGGDPNWGRLIAAAGRAGAEFVLERAAVRIGGVVLFHDGQPFDENAPRAAEHLRGPEVEVEVDLGTGGSAQARMWTCDLSAEYVRINADYRT